MRGNRSRRTVRTLLAIFLGGFGLTACAGLSGGGDDSTLVVQVSGEPEETRSYRAVVEAYEQAHPEADVRLVEVADKDDHLAKLTTSFAAGDPPDVFLVNYREYAQFVTRGAIEPAADGLPPAVDLGGYYPQPLEAFTYAGKLQCMPQNISSLVVYYNTALFEGAGVEPPRVGWTWSEFARTARALTRSDVRGLGIEPSIIRLAPFVWSNGGDVVDDLHSPTRLTFGDPAAREALAFVVDLVREHEVVPTEREVAAQDLETRFTTGKVAMYLSSRKDTPVFREVSGLQWDVAPLPSARQRAGILHSDGYCVARGTERRDEAFDFVAFATGREGQTLTALGGRTVPVLRSVARSNAFLDPIRTPRSPGVFLAGIPHIRRTPVISTWPEIEDKAEEILTRAFYEPGYTIDDAVRDLEEQTRTLFEEGAEG